MTESRHTVQSEPQQVHLDDEIDLRQYIEALIQWRREILLIAFGFALLAGLAVLGLRLSPPQYEASASVAIVRVQSDVTFDQKFTTTSDAQTTASNASARRSALIGLVKSDAIAQKVIDQLGDYLTITERDASQLVANVTVDSSGASGGKSGDSDLIQIIIRSDNPDKAAKIATIWAQIFVKEANSTFGQTPDDLVASVIGMQANAQHEYETKQSTLVKFLTESRVDELSRQIARKEQIIKELQTGEQDALQSLLAQVNSGRGTISRSYLQAQAESEIAGFEARKKGQQELLRAYIGAQYQAQIDVFQQQYQRNLQLLTTYNNATVRLQKTLGSAQVLKTQIESGSDIIDGGTIANLQLLKLQTFTDLLERSTPPVNQAQAEPLTQGEAIGGQEDSPPSVSTTIAQPIQVDIQMNETPLQLQITTGETMSKSAATVEVNSLIFAVKTRLSELNAQISQLGKEMVAGNHYDYLMSANGTDPALLQAIQTQEDVLKSLTTNRSISKVQADSSITTAVSLPFLNFAELEQIATQYKDNDKLLPTAISGLEAEIRQLKSDLEFEQAKQRELSQDRDLAWSTFTTVNNKVAELTVSKAAASSEVRFAAEAVPPIEPIKGPNLLIATAAGGMAGLLLAVFYALVASSMGQAPFLGRSSM